MAQTASAAFDLRRCLDALAQRNVRLPKPVAETVTLWKQITASQPAQPPTEALRDAIIAGADENELGAILLADLGNTRLQTAWSTAINLTASRALDQLIEYRDEVHDQLAEQADALIADLTAVANLGDVPLNTLVREGRHAEAKLVADVDRTAASLTELFELRDLYLTPGRVPHVGGQRF